MIDTQCEYNTRGDLLSIHLQITPTAKPRMTQSDRWKKRPCTQKYWEYKDALQTAITQIDPQGAIVAALLRGDCEIEFAMPVPVSASKKRRVALFDQPHTQKPDLDNLLKGFFDAVLPDDDSGIWQLRGARKIWGTDGCIKIKIVAGNTFSD